MKGETMSGWVVLAVVVGLVLGAVISAVQVLGAEAPATAQEQEPVSVECQWRAAEREWKIARVGFHLAKTPTNREDVKVAWDTWETARKNRDKALEAWRAEDPDTGGIDPMAYNYHDPDFETLRVRCDMKDRQ